MLPCILPPANPVSITRDEVPEDVLVREKEIYIQQALESGKPANIAEKMVAGKIEKFLAEDLPPRAEIRQESRSLDSGSAE